MLAAEVCVTNMCGLSVSGIHNDSIRISNLRDYEKTGSNETMGIEQALGHKEGMSTVTLSS